MPNGFGHTGHKYRLLRAEVMAPRPLICYLCDEYIDPDARYPSPGSKALHCIIPVSRGGPLNLVNCVPTHRLCNLLQSNKMPGEGPFRPARRWLADLEP